MTTETKARWGLPYLHCTFAEDIRQEASGQKTIVGAYQGGVKVVGFPAQISRLAVFADLVLPMESSYKEFWLELRLEDELLQRIQPEEMLLVQAHSAALARPFGKAPKRGYGVQFVFLMNNLTVSTPGLMRLVAVLDGQELYGNAFEFEAAGLVEPSVQTLVS
jgi:hypothetical protein